MTKKEKLLSTSSIKRIYNLISKKELLDTFKLSPKERLILDLHWGKQRTFKEIANQLNVSRERIRQLYETAERRIILSLRKAIPKYQSLTELILINNQLKEENIALKKEIDPYFHKKLPELANTDAKKASSDFALKKTHVVDLNTRITDFHFSVRAINCLKFANIETIKDLLEFSEFELRQYPNLGRRTITEIKEELRLVGLELKRTR